MSDIDLVRELRLDAANAATPAGSRAAARRRLDAVIAAGDQPRRRHTRWVVASAAAAALTVAAVALSGLPGAGSPDEVPTVYADGLAKYPSETAADVVTYADQVVVVTAVSETEIADNAPAARSAAGEGAVYRRMTFRVDRTLWQRPDVRPAPSTFEAVWFGWAMHEHKRSKLVVTGVPWIEVGAQYVMPLADEGTGVAPILPGATFPLRGSVVSLAGRQDSELARQVAGASLPDLGALFARATPIGS